MRIKSLLNFTSLTNQSLAAAIQRELGVEVPPAVRGFQIGRFIETCELRDFLDFISVVTNMMNSADRVGWLRECRQFFSDEHLRYTINDAGGVRFSADAQFEQSVQATLANLGRPELSGARLALEHCLEALSKTPPDGKSAVRNIFEAVEIGSKTLCSGPSRIGETEIQRSLVPLLQARHGADETAKQVAQKLARSLAEWVNAAHFYRHGQTGTEPVQPPLDLVIVLTSEGMGFLRWLAGLYTAKN